MGGFSLSLYVCQFKIQWQKVPFPTFSTFLVTKILEDSLVFVLFFSNFHLLNDMQVIIAWVLFDFDHFSFLQLPFQILSLLTCFYLYFRIFFTIFYQLNLDYSCENFKYFTLSHQITNLIWKLTFYGQKLLKEVWKCIFAVKCFIFLNHASFLLFTFCSWNFSCLHKASL